MKNKKILISLLIAVVCAIGAYRCLFVDMTGAPYSEIEAYMVQHPHKQIRYTVTIDGGEASLTLSNKDTSAELTDIAQADSMIKQAEYLQHLTSITFTEVTMNAETADAMDKAFPNADIQYPKMELLGKAYPADATEIKLDRLTGEQFEQAAQELLWFPQLDSVTIQSPDDSVYTAENAAVLAAALPNITVYLTFDLFGQEVSTDMEAIEYFKADIGDEGLDVFRSIMPIMDKLTYLKLDWCGTTDEATAQLRDELADRCKVVWRVFFGDFNALTDTYKIWAQYYLWSKDVEVLKYCTEVRYIDMGHSYVDSCEFVKYMPYLDTLILADCSLRSIEPLRTCKNLTYLEIFTCNVTDLSPLADLPQLEYLNISNIETTDITPLYGLHNLKKLNSTMNEKIPKDQIEKFKELNPDCDAAFTFADESPTEYGWRRAPAPPYGIYLYTPRYALLRQQIGYDTKDYSRYPKGYLTEEVTYESTGILPPEEYYKEENYE